MMIEESRTNIAVVVVTFNRPHSLNRLLSSIAQAYYPISDIPLIISIDYQDSEAHNEVVKIAEEFEWKYGEKRVIEHKENLGLRKHILSCGCLTEIYSAVIVLEDDIYVSRQYYDYTQQMLDVFVDDEHIAGISLYSHAWNVNANRPFMPEPSGYDVFLMQFAQSWGQCWNVRMWNGFYNWYKDNVSIDWDDVPIFVRNWPATSWLKYHICYTIKADKYFVYPYFSLSTNFSDLGTHHKICNTSYQIVLQSSPMQYRIPLFDVAVKYDAFFERFGIANILGVKEADLCVDLYGLKNGDGKRYLLTTKNLPFKLLELYGLQLRPHELNVIYKIIGNDIHLYDTAENLPLKTRNKNNIKFLMYDYKNYSIRDLIRLILFRIINHKL